MLLMPRQAGAMSSPKRYWATGILVLGSSSGEELDLFLNNSTGHHYVLAWGDHSSELRYLAQMLGVKYVYNQ